MARNVLSVMPEGWKLSVFWFFISNLLNRCTVGPPPLYVGTRVRLAVALFCHANPAMVCVFRGFFVSAVFPPAAVFCRLESPWLRSAVQRETPGSFIDYGWCIISSPLAKLLIEGVMSGAAPPGPAVTDAAKSGARRSDSCFCHVRLCGLCALVACVCEQQRPLWLRVSTRHRCSRPWPLPGVQMSRKRPQGRRLHSCQLSQSVWWNWNGTPNLYLITF